MKLVENIKKEILDDFQDYIKQDNNKKTILNIFLNPFFEICKNEIFKQLYDKSNNEFEQYFSNIIIERINDYLYKDLYPFFIFLFIMIIIIFILILCVIIIILKLNR